MPTWDIRLKPYITENSAVYHVDRDQTSGRKYNHTTSPTLSSNTGADGDRKEMTQNFAICGLYLILRRIILLLLSYLLMSTATSSVSRVVYKAPGPKAHDIQLTCTSVSYIYINTILYIILYDVHYFCVLRTYYCLLLGSTRRRVS